MALENPENQEHNDLPQDKREEAEREGVSQEDMERQADQLKQLRNFEEQEASEIREQAEAELIQGIEETESEDPTDKMIRLVENENRTLLEHQHTFNLDEAGKLVVNIDLPEDSRQCDEEWQACLGFYEPDKHGKLHPVQDPGIYMTTDDGLLDNSALA